MKGTKLPAIEEFLEAVGYPVNDSSARYVAVYWGGGDEAYYEDGGRGGTGEWQAYLMYVEHPRIHAWLGSLRYTLGNSDEEATNWLVFDRATSEGRVLPVKEARKLLKEQWVPIEPVVMTVEQLLQVMIAFREEMEKRQSDADFAQSIADHMMARGANLRKLDHALNHSQRFH